MRELHVVAVSEDGRHVLLAGKRGATAGGFRVALDDRLAAALKGELPGPGQEAPHASDLTPAQIQARFRAGESAEAIAASAGVPVGRVERFSGPVQGEMARMIDATRSSYFVRGRLGSSSVTLGTAVDAAIEATPSLRPDSAEWTTFRQEDGRWLVTVTWFARNRSRRAAWRYDPAARTVTAADSGSAAMAHVDPDSAHKLVRRRAVAVTTPPKKKAPVTTSVAAKRTSAAKKAPLKTPLKTPAGRAGSTAAQKAPVKQSPVKKAIVTKTAVKKPAVKKPAAGSSATKRTSAPAPARRGGPARALRVVPDPEKAKGVTAEERDGVKTRTSVPGWADVLLGTSPGSER